MVKVPAIQVLLSLAIPILRTVISAGQQTEILCKSMTWFITAL